MDHRRRVANRPIELRTAKGWSQQELGARAGLSYKFIGEVERCQKSPSLDSLGQLAEGLEVNVTELFGTSGAPKPVDPLAPIREAHEALGGGRGAERLYCRNDAVGA